ncbi:hypothetical protein HYPGJ_40146 [Hyphomicrobium sp. GJ21]|nr:hypothetical protein HYPGJ_40146 [Hyphomicrobium sp. GJ21]
MTSTLRIEVFSILHLAAGSAKRSRTVPEETYLAAGSAKRSRKAQFKAPPCALAAAVLATPGNPDARSRNLCLNRPTPKKPSRT